MVLNPQFILVPQSMGFNDDAVMAGEGARGEETDTPQEFQLAIKLTRLFS